MYIMYTYNIYVYIAAAGSEVADASRLEVLRLMEEGGATAGALPAPIRPPAAGATGSICIYWYRERERVWQCGIF